MAADPRHVPRLADVVAVLEELYDPVWAEPWDAVGLVCGNPDAPVRRVLLAVDPVAEVADEALAWGADLILTHHPLLLRPVHGVAATTPKGRLVSRLVAAGIALHVAHTNADAASPGVSDALARAVGLTGALRPLDPAPADPVDKLVVFVPREHTDRLVDALAAAGAGSLGAYRRCAYLTDGTGTFRPEEGATPAVGRVGEVATVPETRVEMVLPRERRGQVLRALHAAHPYEEPAYDLLERVAAPGPRGLGRVGELAAPEPLAAFAERVARALPATATGLRVAGDLGRPVSTVAVCGGAGDSLFDAVRRSGADVYLTADLRHHPASEELAHERVALVDAAHWATEWPWLPDAARRLVTALGRRGTTVETAVSVRVTDPWTARVGGAAPVDATPFDATPVEVAPEQPDEHPTGPDAPTTT